MLKSAFIVCFIALLIVSPTLASNDDALQVGLTMDVKKSEVDNSSILYEKAVFYFNSDQVQDIQMRPDLSSSSVILGLLPGNNWGVPCTNDTNATHCSKEDKPVTVSYLSKSYTAYQMNIPSPFKKDNSYSLNKEYLTAFGLSDPAESGKDLFVLGGTGVMGLAPQSPYFSNLFRHYKYTNDSFAFSFEYNPDRNQAWWKETESNGYRPGVLTLNGFSTKDVVSTSRLQNVTVPRNSAWWQVEDVELKQGNLSLVTGQKLCVTNSRNSILAVDSAISLVKKINQELCGKDTPCDASQDKAKASSIILKMNGFQLEIQPTDYIYQGQKNTLDFAIDDLVSWKAQNVCSQDSTLAVGRLFFAKYSVVFHRSSTGDHVIGFAIKKQPRLLTQSERIMFVSIGLGMIAITVIIMGFKLFYERCRKTSRIYDTVDTGKEGTI